jgi:hypothetical protein
MKWKIAKPDFKLCARLMKRDHGNLGRLPRIGTRSGGVRSNETNSVVLSFPNVLRQLEPRCGHPLQCSLVIGKLYRPLR